MPPSFDQEIRFRTAAAVGIAAGAYVEGKAAPLGVHWQVGLTLAAAGLGAIVGMVFDHFAYQYKSRRKATRGGSR